MTALPETMDCVEITKPGGPEVLVAARRPVPKAGEGEILIKVAAAGINRPDVQQRKGRYAPPPGASDLPGLEAAGTVAAIGPGVSGWSVGDPVCALVSGGGYAQYCAAPAPQCLPVPKGISMVEAGGIPETYFTVWTNVFERGSLKAGEKILIHGGSSGIGTTAIQLAKAFGATVFVTANGAEKGKACTDLGADRAIDYATEDFVQVVREATGGAGVDVVLDMVGGEYTQRNLECLATEGRLCQIAFLQGSKMAIDLEPIMRKRLYITGSTLRPRTVAQKGAIAEALHQRVWPLLAAGKCKPLIYKTFPLADAAGAHTLMESSQHIGKIVLVA